jgi:hypothetical protein
MFQAPSDIKGEHDKILAEKKESTKNREPNSESDKKHFFKHGFRAVLKTKKIKPIPFRCHNLHAS